MSAGCGGASPGRAYTLSPRTRFSPDLVISGASLGKKMRSSQSSRIRFVLWSSPRSTPCAATGVNSHAVEHSTGRPRTTIFFPSHVMTFTVPAGTRGISAARRASGMGQDLEAPNCWDRGSQAPARQAPGGIHAWHGFPGLARARRVNSLPISGLSSDDMARALACRARRFTRRGSRQGRGKV